MMPSKGSKGKRGMETMGKCVRWMAGSSTKGKYQDRWEPEIGRNTVWTPSDPPYRDSSDPVTQEVAGSEPAPGAFAGLGV